MSSTIARRKDNKAGKFVSLGVIGCGVGMVVILIIGQLVNKSFHSVQGEFDRDVVAVTPVTEGDKLQPNAAKIVASDNVSMTTKETSVAPEAYADVWLKLERLAPASANDTARLAAIETFLSGLDYKMTSRGGDIVSITDGSQINPSTLACYLNGYIPDKPYLKPNCPSF